MSKFPIGSKYDENRMGRALREPIQCIESSLLLNAIQFRVKSCTKAYEAVYRVTVEEKRIQCTCKDFEFSGDKAFCKHILNVIYKRMRYVPWKHFPDAKEIYEKAKTAHTAGKSLIPRPIATPLTPLTDSECQICCETMFKTINVSCKQCKQQIHKDCFATWEKEHARCPYCNAAMSLKEH